MRYLTPVLIAATLLADEQVIEPVQMQHLCTFGSRDGIHPPPVLKRKASVAAGGHTEHPYGLGFPEAVAVDLRGRVWITDSATASIHVFDLKGGAYREIKRAGTVPFEQPAGITSDRQGRMYMVDQKLAAVFVFDESGEYARAMVKPGQGVLTSPTAIALSENGRTVYVADPPRNLIVALNREGEVDGSFPLTDATRNPAAINVANNQIYVLGNIQNKVEIFSPAGKRRGDMRWEGIRNPTAFAYDIDKRRFLVANPNMMVVEVFGEDGRSIGAFGHLGDRVDETRRIEGIHIDAQGLVYLIDSHHGKVVVFRETR